MAFRYIWWSFFHHQEKNTIRQSSKILGIQTPVASCYRWEDNAMTLVFLSRGRQEKHPEYQKCKKVIESSVENFVPVVAVTKQKAVPSIEFSSAKGNLEREKEVEDTMLGMSEPFTEGLERYASSSTSTAWGDPKHAISRKTSWRQPPSVVTDPGRHTLAKETKSKKAIIGSEPRGNHNVFTHCMLDPKCEVSKKTKTTRARCRINL